MIQISAIVIYSHDGRSRSIPLDIGKVNIISGDSRTGKSAILGIISYCFGASEIDVPEGKVRRNVSWFGLLLKTSKGEAFIARQLPLGDGKSNEVVFIQMGAELEVPDAAELRQTTNREGLRSQLAAWSGLTDFVHEPPSGHIRIPLAATITHALSLCLQSQNEIGQRRYLFHGSSDRFVAQAIKDTLPYFLGAVSDDYVANQHELKRVRAEIRQIERQLNEAASIRGNGVSRVDSLLAEARAANLSSLDGGDIEWGDKVKELQRIQSTPLPDTANEVKDNVEFQRLILERKKLLQEQQRLEETLERALSFEGNSKGFSAEAREHKSRLNAISIFDSETSLDACPLCLQHLPDESAVPSIKDLKSAQEYIGERSGAMDSATPHIETAILGVESSLESVREKLGTNRALLNAIKQSNQRLQLVSDLDSRRSLILGRISLYVENLPEMPDLNQQEERLGALRLRGGILEQAVSNDVIQQRLDSCLSNVNKYLSEYAENIHLEYSEYPLRLDPRNLTIVADTPERPITMAEIGSGENHVGYHIVAHLALHTWFTKRDRPVPSFLLLDQLSQAHFSPDASVGKEVTQEKIDADRKAVKALYGLIFDVVEKLEGKFQVLITDHPDFADDARFQSALRERWRGGLKLVPEDWPTIQQA